MKKGSLLKQTAFRRHNPWNLVFWWFWKVVTSTLPGWEDSLAGAEFETIVKYQEKNQQAHSTWNGLMHFFYSLESYCELPFFSLIWLGFITVNPDLWSKPWSRVFKCNPDMGDKILWNTQFNISIVDFTISKWLEKNPCCFTYEIISNDDR